MNLLLSALAAAFGATVMVQAVDIVLYPGNVSCLPGFAALACFDVEERYCCRPSMGGWPYFSGAKCEGLRPEDSCAIATVTGTAFMRPCGPTCASAPGPGGVCVGASPCWSSPGTGFGMYWFERPRGAEVAAAAAAAAPECAGVVEPDRAVFANGRAFRINYDVPKRVSAMLVALVHSDPQLSQGVPAEAAPFEIDAKQEN